VKLWNRSQSEFFNMFLKIPNFDMIQCVEYYWKVIWVQNIRDSDIWHSDILVDPNI
jgi:hypothetical protein